jgi:hypothetical protein
MAWAAAAGPARAAGSRLGPAHRLPLALLTNTRVARRSSGTADTNSAAYVNRAPQAGAVSMPVPPDVRDYSLHAGPLTGLLFEQLPTTRAAMAPFMLSPSQVPQPPGPCTPGMPPPTRPFP